MGSMGRWGLWGHKDFQNFKRLGFKDYGQEKLSQEAVSREVATVMSLRYIKIVGAASSKP